MEPLLRRVRPIGVSRTLQSAFLLAVLGVVAAGCASPAPVGTASGSPSSVSPVTSSPAPPSPAASPPPASTEVLPLDFTRTGGFAGVDDHLTIAADGTVTVQRRSGATKSTPLSAAKLAELKRLLADPALTGSTQPPASRGAVCADGFSYRFRTPSWSLVRNDCGGSTQPAVDRVLQFVGPLL